MITVLDTSICSENLGDQIIMDSVWRELREIFPREFFVNAPTHDTLGDEAIALLNSSRYGVVGGTNLLSSNMAPSYRKKTWRRRWAKRFPPRVQPYDQWKLRVSDMDRLVGNIVLLGVGWWQYQDDPMDYTRKLLGRVLTRDRLHSVRDEYTRGMLAKAGVKNVINTSCVTMWRLTPEHLAGVPERPAGEVISTLTCYKPDLARDAGLLNILRRRYSKVHLWIQGSRDMDYIRQLPAEGIEFVAPTLAAFDAMLDRAEPIDYVGTRLHAGVRALQKRRRTFIVSVDNRATEIARDTGLPVIERSEVDRLDALLPMPSPLRLNLPYAEINRWRGQFVS